MALDAQNIYQPSEFLRKDRTFFYKTNEAVVLLNLAEFSEGEAPDAVFTLDWPKSGKMSLLKSLQKKNCLAGPKESPSLFE